MIQHITKAASLCDKADWHIGRANGCRCRAYEALGTNEGSMLLPVRESRNASSRTEANRERSDALEDIAGLRAPAAKAAKVRTRSGALKSAHSRNMSFATTEHKTHKQRRRHRHGKDGHGSQNVDSERRHRHRTKQPELDSDAEYVYPRERRTPQERRPGYEEVRKHGRHGDEKEDDAEAVEDGRTNVRDERHRSSRPSGSHHHRRHRDGAERPRERRTHRPRTIQEERERDERRRDRRAAKDAEHTRELPPSRGRHEHRVEPHTSFLSKLFGKR